MSKTVSNDSGKIKTQAGKKTWVRLYVELLDDRKVQSLPPHLFKTWVNILCLAGLADGVLPSVDDIAFRLRISSNDASTQVDELVLAGLIDIKPDRTMAPHNWSRRQFVWDGADRTNAARQKRIRNKRNSQSNGRRNGCVTVGVTENPSVSVSVSEYLTKYSSHDREVLGEEVEVVLCGDDEVAL